ncbi:profilin [Hypomontagnella monticulosa]|nr:profilin [Hypomontagnella monticulosa]
MSWQGYIDSTYLVGSGHVDKGAIISAAGDSVWATSPGFTVKPEEMKNLVAILNDAPGARDNAHAEGIHVAGVRYVAADTRADDGIIYGRKQDQSGVCFTKTKQAIIIAHHAEGQIAGNARQTVWTLAKYLIDQGY